MFKGFLGLFIVGGRGGGIFVWGVVVVVDVIVKFVFICLFISFWVRIIIVLLNIFWWVCFLVCYLFFFFCCICFCICFFCFIVFKSFWKKICCWVMMVLSIFWIDLMFVIVMNLGLGCFFFWVDLLLVVLLWFFLCVLLVFGRDFILFCFIIVMVFWVEDFGGFWIGRLLCFFFWFCFMDFLERREWSLL